MFGQNEIVGQKYFKNAGDKLFITSMFFTMQGEGPYRGKPAFFLRLAKCNLACSFCDTYFDHGDWLSLEEINWAISDRIAEYFGGTAPAYYENFTQQRDENGYFHPKKREMVLVLTGGEPMLQHNIGQFLIDWNKSFKHTQIESNGLIWQDLPPETTLVVSPKCNEKDGKATQYLNPNKKVLERADCLKFVMEADENSPYSSIPEWAYEWLDNTKKEIFISPMNMYLEQPVRKAQGNMAQRNKEEVISFWTPGLLDMKTNQKNHEYTAQYCLNNGLTFNLQQHLYAGLA